MGAFRDILRCGYLRSFPGGVGGNAYHQRIAPAGAFRGCYLPERLGHRRQLPIAVYLFITGPGLDTRGVTLENLNIAAGRGLFTTAPVNLSNGCWTYQWDTSVILGISSGDVHDLCGGLPR